MSLHLLQQQLQLTRRYIDYSDSYHYIGFRSNDTSLPIRPVLLVLFLCHGQRARLLLFGFTLGIEG